MIHERERQAGERLDDQREAVGQVVAGAAVEPHSRSVLTGNDTEAIVLDLVQPGPARARFWGLGGKARGNKTGWQGTRTRRHDVA
jgi:hypothetical protein